MLHSLSIARLILLTLEVRGGVTDCICILNPAADKLQNAIIVLQTLHYFLLLARHRAADKIKLAQLSYMDSLTGLFNRNRYIQIWIRRCSFQMPPEFCLSISTDSRKSTINLVTTAGIKP